ncbi:hypothetical protein KAT63_02020 [Candidatus Parcubacteria bacterium]|nr:hypothetical protein [Candidatus Parcubacteria bacterium]
MKNPDKKLLETASEQGAENQTAEDIETQIKSDSCNVNESQKNIEEILEEEQGNPKADEIIKEGRKNVRDSEENLSDFETEISEEDHKEILSKMMGDNKEKLTSKEEKIVEEIGMAVEKDIKNNRRIAEWETKDDEKKEDAIEEKDLEFKERFEFKKGKREIEESRIEVAKKKKEIKKAVKESTEKYKDMEEKFKNLLSQNEVCNLLEKDEKEELMGILGSLSTVIKNEIDLRKLEYIEAKLDNPDKLLENHAYCIVEIENLEKAALFFDKGLERLGEEEGDLLEKFLKFLKDHPELLKYATLIALAVGFVSLAAPAAEVIAETGIMLKLAGAVKSAAIIGCLMAGYTLIDEKKRDGFMAWITGTGKVPDWAWFFSDYKYGQESK